jgi:hypothetical protein
MDFPAGRSRASRWSYLRHLYPLAEAPASTTAEAKHKRQGSHVVMTGGSGRLCHNPGCGPSYGRSASENKADSVPQPQSGIADPLSSVW